MARTDVVDGTGDRIDATNDGTQVEFQWTPPPTFASIFPEEEPPLLPTYSEDGIDLTVIRTMLALSPLDRLRTAQNNADFVQRVRNARKIL